jgi:TonB-dependent starch-binding outer membrane protein SusC
MKKIYQGMKNFILLLFFLVTAFSVIAQNRSISGKVTDASGIPVPKASVLVKGTSIGTTTNDDGSFSLSVPANARVLVVSSVGLAVTEVAIGNRSSINIQLQEENKSLEEVVVVAYGTQVKKKVTGAVTKVGGEEFENRPFASFDQMLQGKAAGVQSVSPNGQPGGAQTIRIRGVSSVTGNNDPLYVVDGIPINTGDFSRNTETSNALAGINPNDIESVSVLKDAAATSIYGSRASSGVILITTKKGKQGKSKLRFDFENGYGNVAFFNDNSKPLNAQQYYDLTREGLVNAGASPAQVTSTLTALGNGNGYDENWFDLVTRQGKTLNANLSLSGGDAKTTFYTSIGYFKQTAPVKGSDFSRYSANLNVRHKVNQKFTFGINIIGGYTNQNSPSDGGAFRNPVLAGYFLRPGQNAYNPDGTLNVSNTIFNQVYNPLGIIEYDRGLFNNLKTISTVSGEYNILKDLKFTTKFGIDYINIEEESYRNPFFGDSRTTGGSVSNLSTRLSNWVWTNMLDYHKDLFKSKDLGMDLKVGYEAQKSKQFNITANGNGLPQTQLIVLPAPSTPTSARADRIDFSQVSYFSIAQFDYKRKYSVSGSIRRDAASRFGPDSRVGYFWSTGVAWNIDEEDFFKNVNFIDALKLRSSFGTSGDNRGVTPYEWRSTYSFDPANNYNQLPGSTPAQVGNTDLTWEQSQVFNISAEFSMLKNRIGGTIEYYRRKSTDLIFAVPLSRTAGFNDRNDNIGSMENKGWEITLNGTPVRTKDFTWDINFNISLNKNKILNLPNGADIRTGNLIRRVGENVQSIFTRAWAGVDPANGNPLWYTDASRKTTTSTLPGYREIIGSTMPDGFGSLSTTFKYKGFSLDAQFNYQYGNTVYDNWGFITWSDGAFGSLNKINKQLGRWQKPGDITDIPKYVYNNANNSNGESSRWYYKGDFVRLRELTISYQVPRSFVTKTKIDNAVFYMRGSNLWTKAFDKDITFDPEQGFAGTNNLQVLIQRVITFGVNIGF